MSFAPETFRRRRERALAALENAVLVLPAAPVRYKSRDSEYPYRPDSELFYLTGATEPDSLAVLRPGADEPFTLFVRERDPEAELWTGERLGPERARERFQADAVHPIAELEQKLAALLTGPQRILHRWGASARVDHMVLDALARARARGPRKGTGPRAVVDPGEILDELRLIKDAEEIALLRRAADISVDAFRAALAAARPGIGEWELQAILEGAFRRAGGDGPAYETIVGGGPRACVLHYVENRCPVGDRELVLIDAGAAAGLYHADITRTFPVSGRFTAEQRAVYEIVERARAAGVGAARPGATIAQVHGAAALVIAAGLVELGVLQGEAATLVAEEKHKPFYPHTTSHWLGLDVHDVGDYEKGGESRVLEPGMVFTVEPGLYFRDPETAGRFTGIGVRVEDDVLITATGCENLTGALPTAADRVAELVGH